MMPPKIWFVKHALASAILLASAAACAASLQITTENSPPLIMLENGKITGRTTDRIRLLMERAKVSINIDAFPWRRAYAMAVQNHDTCVYPTTRTPDRENIFKWVGPIAVTEWVLYSNTSRQIKLKTLEDALPYTIGTYYGDARDDFLRAKGFKVESVSDDLLNPQKLLLNRIDLWATGVPKAALLIYQNGWEDKITQVLSFNKVDLFLACNPAVSAKLIEELNNTIQVIQREGGFKITDEKYAR